VDSPLPNSNHVFALTPRPVAVTSITNERGSTSLVFSALDQSGEQTFDFDCPGAKLAAGSTDDIVLLWCPKNGGIQLVEKAGFGANWSYMRFSDDPGEPLMLEAGGDVILIDPNGQIDVFDLASRQIVAEYTREVRPLAAAIDPDSSSIVIATGGGAVADTIWALQPSGSWPGATSVPLSLPISQMAFSGNVAYVLGATYDSSFIGMLDVETGEVTVILDTFGTDLRGDLRLVALR
jgi:WD40 repeat protein